MKKMFLLLIAVLSVGILSAQSIVGTWKTISNIAVDNNGKTDDLSAMQRKMMPCLSDLQTIFDANGKQYQKSPKNCGPMDYNKLAPSTWKMTGNTLSITNKSIPTPLGTTSTYTVEFVGNKAILTHEYTKEETKKLYNTKTKKIIITYQRL